MANSVLDLSTWLATGVFVVIGVSICVQQRNGVLAKQTDSAPTAVAAHIPFVGCESDGQGGSVDAPTGSAQTVVMAPDVAKQLNNLAKAPPKV